LLSGYSTRDLPALSEALTRVAGYRESAADYGLSDPAFLLLETFRWFAQSMRAGALSYFEAAQPQRQAAFHTLLKSNAPPDFAVWYARGMGEFQDDDRIFSVDAWMMGNEQRAHRWMWEIADRNRTSFEQMCD
jgi:hypothetical protein